MESWILVLIVVIPILLFFAVPWFLKRSRRQAATAAIKNGRGIFSTWHYTPAEWQFAAEQYFNIRTRDGDSGQVSFTPQYIYISSGKKDVFWELAEANKHVKHLTEIYLFKDSPMNLIKFDVRKKIVRTDQDGNETEKCSLEEFYVPIPADYNAETDKIMKFYQSLLDQNADAVAAVMPYGLGMFGQ